jgi:large subunit ribosomal protein L29
MARPAIAEVRKLTDDQILEQINGTRRQLFDLRFQQATRRLENPHRFREARILLAHLQTVQRERQLSSAS